jgi:hypothetical protein
MKNIFIILDLFDDCQIYRSYYKNVINFKLNFDIEWKKMGNSQFKQHIETAQKTGACQLSKLGLKEVFNIKIKWHNHRFERYDYIR